MQELTLDVDDLRKLEALATQDDVRTILQKEIAVFTPQLAGKAQVSTAPPAIGAAAPSSSTATTQGYDADADDGSSAAGSASKAIPTTGTHAVAATPSLRTPLNTQSRESSTSAALEQNTPADAFEPTRWPEASKDALQTECWWPAQGHMLQVPRWPYDSPQARRLMAEGKPVILTRAPLTASASRKWNLDYLVRNLGELPCTVFRRVLAPPERGPATR